MKHGVGMMQSLGEVAAGLGTNESVARPTLYKGIQMRSRLEAAFAWHLDELGEEWQYEPAIYGPLGQGYKPDFEILSAPRPTFIEVKPTLNAAKVAMERMPIIWDTHHNALLIVACAEESRFFEASWGGEWASFQERWRHG